jgi:hypothetical protein
VAVSRPLPVPPNGQTSLGHVSERTDVEEGIEPDQGKYVVALRDLLLKIGDVVAPERNRVHVHEDISLAQVLEQPIVDPPGYVAGRIPAPTVVDEDLGAQYGTPARNVAMLFETPLAGKTARSAR